MLNTYKVDFIDFEDLEDEVAKREIEFPDGWFISDIFEEGAENGTMVCVNLHYCKNMEEDLEEGETIEDLDEYNQNKYKVHKVFEEIIAEVLPDAEDIWVYVCW